MLGVSDIGKTIRMDSEFLQIRFVVSETASTCQGFKLTLTSKGNSMQITITVIPNNVDTTVYFNTIYRIFTKQLGCPKGFILVHKICSCPPGSFISFAGDCIESHNMVCMLESVALQAQLYLHFLKTNTLQFHVLVIQN